MCPVILEVAPLPTARIALAAAIPINNNAMHSQKMNAICWLRYCQLAILKIFL